MRDKAYKASEYYVSEAEKRESEITKALTSAAQKGTGKLVDLDTKIKSVQSLADKMMGDVLKEKISLTGAANKIYDVLRYTLLSEDDDFVENYFKTIEYLKDQGYNVFRVKNKFIYEKEAYRAINSIIVSKGGYKFELQFHTPSSLEAKRNNHALYKEEQMESITEDRKKDIRFEMKQNVSRVGIPRNIADIKEIL